MNYTSTPGKYAALSGGDADPLIFDAEFKAISDSIITKTDSSGTIPFVGPIGLFAAAPTGETVHAIQAQSIKHYAFTPGTRLVFAQTSAPTGWTQDTVIQNDSMLRVINTTGTVPAIASASGGLVSPISTGATATGSHALLVTEMPAHTHSYLKGNTTNAPTGNFQTGSPYYVEVAATTGSTGGTIGGTAAGHSHAIPAWQPKYINTIVCVKN